MEKSNYTLNVTNLKSVTARLWSSEVTYKAITIEFNHYQAVLKETNFFVQVKGNANIFSGYVKPTFREIMDVHLFVGGLLDMIEMNNKISYNNFDLVDYVFK